MITIILHTIIIIERHSEFNIHEMTTIRNMIKRYILNPDKSIQLEPNLNTWHIWYQKFDSHLFRSEFNLNCKLLGAVTLTFEEIVVSTVFLGIDHQINDNAPPLIFETQIFVDGQSIDNEEVRYSTYREARLGHYLKVDRIKALYRQKGYTL